MWRVLYRVARALEVLGERARHVGLVLHEEDARTHRRSGLDHHVGVAGAGESDGERGTHAHLARDPDLAAVAAEDGMHHRETEAGPLAGRLGGVEGIEDVLQMLGRDADARVPYFEADTAVGGDPRPQLELAALGH